MEKIYSWISHHLCGKSILESVVDERGRVLIPQKVRESTGIREGTIVEMRQNGRKIELIPTSKKKLRSWRDLRGLKPKRTGKPSWPTPQEIKAMWE